MTLVMSGAVRVVLLAAGQNVLHPHSHAQHEINVLWWVMFVGSCIGMMLVAFLLLLGWLRRNKPTLPFGVGERGATGLVIGLGIAFPILLLSALFFWSDVFVIRSTAAPNPRSTSMTVRVIGHQWWWEIRYPGTSAVTANEMHIPVDTPVYLRITAADVIHSFWVPALAGKKDAVPGRTDYLTIEGSHIGEYAGTCAEYCGLSHANMHLKVFVDSKAEYAKWFAVQQSGPTAALDQLVFAELPPPGPWSS